VLPRTFLALFNPRAEVQISAPPAPGVPVALSWRFLGNAGRLRRLTIKVEGREEATYRRGTDTTTVKRTFARYVVLDTTEPSRIASGETLLALPADTMHTFEASRNKVLWSLKLHGDIPNWPDIDDEVALTVYPTALAWAAMRGAAPPASGPPVPLAHRVRELSTVPLLSGFAVGFCILFAFIGVFTYVNFVLVRPPLALGMMSVGFVYFVFLPSILLTPLAGGIVGRWGVRPALWTGLGVAASGLPLLLSPVLAGVLLGMVLVGAGTFFAQATATGFVSRAATTDRAGASGIYLAAYFSGGLVGSAALGQAFDRFGWPTAVAGVALALALAAILDFNLRTASEPANR